MGIYIEIINNTVLFIISMGIYAFAISIFFISWAMIFGICIDYRSAESIGIRVVLYLKRTFNEDLAERVNL